MRARLVDPAARSAAARAAPLIAGAIALGAFLPFESPVFRAQALLAALAVLAGLPLLGRTVEGEGDFVAAPGTIATPDGTVVLRAGEIATASTASDGERARIAIEKRHARGRPLTLELSAADAARVSDALGLGRGNVGTLRWRTRASGVRDGLVIFARGYVAFVALALAALQESPALPWAISLVLVTLVPFALVGGGVAMFARAPEIALASDTFRTPDGRLTAYADIDSVALTEARLRLLLRDGGAVEVELSLSATERAHVAAHIAARVRLAKQGNLGRAELPRAVLTLARGAEPAREWLARIDRVAQSVAGGGGYREVDIDTDALYVALADPEAPSDVRAAAARILLRVAPEEARRRVEDVLAVVHDDEARERIRIATDDDENAAADDLEKLDRARR